MKAKPVVPREQAHRDIDQAIAYYLGEDAGPAAMGFIDAVQQAYRHIGFHPATGSSRYAHELNLPGLRCWPLTRYPYGNAEKFPSMEFFCSPRRGTRPRRAPSGKHLVLA